MARRVTPDEESLWRYATSDVAPMKRRVPAKARRKTPETTHATPKRTAATMPIGVRPLPAPEPRTRVVRAADPFERPGLDAKRAEKFLHGELRIEATIDLHGLTQERAHRTLIGFLRRAHDEGRRMVLLITGKGGEGRVSVLREMTPRWLAEPGLKSMIVALAPAHAKHGGAGALYVYLKRKR